MLQRFFLWIQSDILITMEIRSPWSAPECAGFRCLVSGRAASVFQLPFLLPRRFSHEGVSSVSF